MSKITESISIAERYGSLRPRVMPKTGPKLKETLAVIGHLRKGPPATAPQPQAKPGVAPVPN